MHESPISHPQLHLMTYFTSSNHRLFYREQGSGPLLLILHGNTASTALHSGELVYFAQHYHAVALDFLGCGQSDRLAMWPLDWWAQGGRDAAALVQHLGYERALVMGTSGGAIAALWMAIEAPLRVQAVIADSTVEHETADWIERELRNRRQLTPEQRGFWRQAHGDDWQQVVNADSDLLHRFAQSGGDWFQGRLNEVRCPVLFSASLRDELLQEPGRQNCEMALQVKGSRVYFATQGVHPLMWSRADDFRRAVDWFLNGIADSAAFEDQ
ncbi:MAG TPA: alpha/beta hydrolase [Anaerolineae bacterium]